MYIKSVYVIVKRKYTNNTYILFKCHILNRSTSPQYFLGGTKWTQTTPSCTIKETQEGHMEHWQSTFYSRHCWPWRQVSLQIGHPSPRRFVVVVFFWAFGAAAG